MRPSPVGILSDRLGAAVEVAAAVRASRRFELFGVFVDADELRARISGSTRPVVLILVRPTADVLTAARLACGETVRMLIVDEPKPEAVEAVLDDRAQGLIRPTATPGALLGAVHQLLCGSVVLPSTWRRIRDGDRQTPDLSVLGERQREVLELLALGRTNDEIGRALFISVNTVKFHLRAAYSALGVRTRAEAAALISRAAARA